MAVTARRGGGILEVAIKSADNGLGAGRNGQGTRGWSMFWVVGADLALVWGAPIRIHEASSL
jgi:hypothetical protein